MVSILRLADSEGAEFGYLGLAGIIFAKPEGSSGLKNRASINMSATRVGFENILIIKPRFSLLIVGR